MFRALMMRDNAIIREKRKCIDMENLAEDTYIAPNFAWLDDPENEVSDEENEEILLALESLSDDDLKIVRRDIVLI